MTSRRDFVKQSAVLAAGSLISIEKFKTFIAKPTTVVVIGAGFAGLSAAAYLKKKKIRVTVLEARTRIGGRVHSMQVPDTDCVIELGAEWVGKSHERILEMCENFKLELFNNQFETHLLYKGQYQGKG
ncbi:MAG: flavin monoamine oxidase family protein, partial [Flavisolibacter sp.]